MVFASQATVFTVTSPADAGAGTLRQALQDISNLNTGVGGHVINFNAAMSITLSSSLNLNADTDYTGLTINGFVDAVAGPDVIITSNNLCGIRGFNINASITNMKFYGLVFQNLEYGIYFNASASGTVNGSEVKGCYFGTNVSGSVIQNGICKSGILFIGVSSATIGGPNTNLANGDESSTNNPERCVFGGTCIGAGDNNRYGAIQLQNGSNNVSIINNYIGSNLAGTAVLPIGNVTNKKPVTQNGISIDDNPSFNAIISNNVISGAIGSGINIFTNSASSGHVISGNIIGLNPAGTLGYNVTTPASSFGNQASGIYIRNASNVTIGGNSAITRNIISANGGATHTWPDPGCFASWNDYNQIAVYLEWCTNSKISGNYIGTNALGTSSGIGTNNIFGNRSGGIKIVGGSTGSNNNIIGGANPGEGNVISGNGYLWGTFALGSCGSLSGISTGHGVVLQYADCKNTSILGNYIGLTSDGVSALGNATSGIDVQGASNTTIGGSSVSARNYICANQFGITLQEDFDAASHNAAANTIVAGNYIGLNKNSAAVGNGVSATFTEGAGIVIQKGANLSTIGLAVAGGGNVISGNRSGIIVRNAEGAGSNTGPAKNNTIQNNIIGLDPTGLSAIPNTSTTAGYGYGIQIEVGTGSATNTIPFANIIGGTGANQANTISGNQKSGIYIASAVAVTASTANSIIGNNIGTNSVGTGSFGNTLQGIEIVNVSKTAITSNVISSNKQNGISLTGSTTNTIQLNTVSTNSVNGIYLSGSSSNDISSNTAINSNGANGIALTGSSSNTIKSNTISSNTSDGIALASASASNIMDSNILNTNGGNGVTVTGSTSINNSIHKNSFSCNVGRGIVLAGGNNNYAAPTIVGTPTQLVFTGGSFIEVFQTDGCATCPGDPTRLQGKTLVASGASPFSFTTGLGFDKTKTYTATASAGTAGSAHNTSEFSQCYTVCQNPTSVTITGSPLSFCTGGSVTLTAKIVGGSGTEKYIWTLDGSVTGGNTASISANVAGSYKVEYSSTTTCSTTTSEAAIVVINPRPTITSVATGTVCSGVAQNYTITSSIASTFTWTRAAVTNITSATGSGSTSTITEILTNSTNAPIVVEYLITPTSTTGSCTSTTPFSYKVTVNPMPTVTSVATGTICSGVAQNYTITSSVPSTFTWTRAAITNIAPTTGSGSTNKITETLTNSTNAAIDVVYLITPTSNTGSCVNATPFTYTVTVNPKPSITSVATGAVCSGVAQNYTITSSVPSTFTWTRAAVTNITQNTGSGSTNTIKETLTNSTNAPIDVVYLITPTSNTGSCENATPFTYTVTVNPKPKITSDAAGIVCSGEAQNYKITSSVPSTFTWTRAAVTNITSATGSGSTNTITETLTNSTNAPIDVVYLITPTSNTGSCVNATPFTYTVTVNPKPKITSVATGTVCSGVAQNYTITSSVPSTFTWTRAAVTNITSATGSGSTNTITETLTNSTASPIDVVYLITPTSNTGTCVNATPFTYTVTVNPKPTITSVATGIVCSGAAQNYKITSSVPSTFTWTRAAVTNITSATGSGSTNTISEALTNGTTLPIDVVYLITPTSNTGSCVNATPFTYTVTVNPTPIVTDKPASICSEQTFTVTPTGVAVGTTYTWTAPSVTGNVTGTSAESSQVSISQTLKNNGLTDATIIYTVTPSSGACPGNSFKVTVTVKPQAGVANQPKTICSGEEFKVEPTNVPAGTTYTWADPTRAGVTGGSAEGTPQTLIKQTLTNSGNVAGTATYIVTPSSSSCGSSTFLITVTVNPNPVVTSSATDNVCSDSPLTYPIGSNVASGYTWTRDLVTGIKNDAASGTSSQISETLKNTTTSAVDVVYIITPTSTSGSCLGDAFTYTVTVNPKAVVSVTASGPTAICSTGSVDLTADAIGYTGGSYEWFNGTTSMGSTNPITVSSASNYTVVYTGTSTCKSDPSAGVSITIAPNNSLAAAGIDFSTCLGSASLEGNIPDFGLGAWSVATGYTATIIPGLDPTKVDVSGLIDGNSYKFVYTVSGEVCGGPQRDTIEIHAGLTGLLVNASGPSDTLCVTKNRNLFAQATGGSGSYTYVWISSDASFSTKTTDKNIVVKPINDETIYTVYVLDNKNPGCRTNDATVKVDAVKSQNLYIPNLITPNGDGKNDVFFLADVNTGFPMIQEGSHVEIINRWGSKVFEADNYDNKWIPTDVTDGMYYYHVTSSCGNKEYKSWLQILGNNKN